MMLVVEIGDDDDNDEDEVKDEDGDSDNDNEDGNEDEDEFLVVFVTNDYDVRCIISFYLLLQENIIPQVPFHTILSKFNGVLEKEYKTYKDSTLKRFELTKLPPYVIVYIKVSTIFPPYVIVYMIGKGQYLHAVLSLADWI